jgi:predicted MFS family arabinose efflux permease
MGTVGAPLKRYGAFPVVALAGTIALEQGERLSLSQALDGIQDEFAVSDTALGFLAAAMVLIGVAGSIPFGVLADRWRRVTLMAIAMVVWTACMGLSSVAPTFAFLFVARMGIGIVEANGPAAVSLMADYYPVANRARMMGRYQLGAAFGGLIGVALAGVLVDTFSWRAAFVLWIPLGVVVAFLCSRLPEPERGSQDRAFAAEEIDRVDADGIDGLLPDLHLPEVHLHEGARARDLSWGDVIRRLLQIRSMWFGLMALTISQFFSGALAYWGIEFFKRAFDLNATRAGAFAPVIGAGAVVGLFAGGEVADRLLRRGDVNARVHVVAASSVLASVFLLPAFLSTSLVIASVSLFFGSLFLTMPVAPAEALVTDVVPVELRGRASAVRSVVRSVAALSPFVVGVLSEATDLSTALAIVSPLYALGGLLMLLAAKSYPGDLAVVANEARASVSSGVIAGVSPESRT